MAQNTDDQDDTRHVLLGFALGAASGGAFGGMFAVWFRGGISALSMIIVLHAAFAGAAMGGWLLPTLRAD